MYETFFKQIKGTAMGLPLSMIIADLVMQYVENKIIQKSDQAIKLNKRYVDDVFLVARDEDLPKILEIANSICSSIQFTIKFRASVYRKPTFSGEYINFRF